MTRELPNILPIKIIKAETSKEKDNLKSWAHFVLINVLKLMQLSFMRTIHGKHGTIYVL
jgi:hypothetical protein